MRFDIYLFISQYLIFYNQYNFAIAKALIGENVRLAQEGEFPFIASIMRVDPRNTYPERDHFCTGALISKLNILTGAHCLEDESLNGVRIILGDITLRTNNKYYPLWWITYNEWATMMDLVIEFATNDVAIIRLNETVPDNIRPAIISRRSNKSLFGKNVRTAGWGQTHSEEFPIMLRTVDLKVISNEECNVRATRIQGETVNLHERLLCTIGHPNALLHFGDSGGPLLYGNEIVGINYGTCPLPEIVIHMEKVNVHFSIEAYRKFILAVNI